ncbi:MAG: hypothetical protein AB9844_10510 [Clostridiaceae bacterium]
MLNKTLKRCGIVLALAVSIVLLPLAAPSGISAVSGATVNQEMHELGANQTIDKTGFFSGDLIQIDGTVEGTAFAFGQEIRINGTINGDLVTAGQNIYINGTVKGNIYAAGQNVNMAAQAAQDVFLAGQRIDVAKDALIGRDLFVGGATILMNGAVQRDFAAGGQDISVGGIVSRDSKLDAQNITLSNGANIKGDLYYSSQNKANISSGAVVEGKTDWQYVKPVETVQNKTFVSSLTDVLWGIAGALLIWFLVRIWRPEFWTNNAITIDEKPLKSIGTGILALIVTPVLAILLLITVVGIPLGIILGLVYGVAIYLSKIVVAAFIGYWLSKRFKWAEMHKGIWGVLLGLIILAVLTNIQYIDFISWLLIVFAGLGTLVLTNYRPSKTSGNKPDEKEVVSVEGNQT